MITDDEYERMIHRLRFSRPADEEVTGYCPIHQAMTTIEIRRDEVTRIGDATARHLWTFLCPTHPQFCHQVTISGGSDDDG